MNKKIILITSMLYLFIMQFGLNAVAGKSDVFLLSDWSLFSFSAVKEHIVLIDNRDGTFVMRDQRSLFEKLGIDPVDVYYSLQNEKFSEFRSDERFCNFSIATMKGSLYEHYIEKKNFSLTNKEKVCE